MRQAPRPQTSFRWDDARVLLALHRARSLAGAAAILHVDASTVGRRVDALEEALGARLFERTPDGAVPTAVAEELVPHAEAMERAATELEGSAGSFERTIEGVVRLSVPPGIADLLVVPLLPGLREQHPKLRIELDSRVAYVDLARREADLALRGIRPDRGDLVTARLAQARSLPYASPALASALGTVRDLASVPWITYGPDLAHIEDARWVAAGAPETAIVLRVSAFSAQLAAAERGLGAMLIAEPLAADRPLARLTISRAALANAPPYPEGALWLVAHRAMRSIPRVAAVWDFLLERVAAHSAAARRSSRATGASDGALSPARARIASQRSPKS